MLKYKVLKIITKHNLLSSLDKVLVGVSGGPDSIALLYLFNELKVGMGIRIVVGHLNHGLRGKESDLDEKFVKETADSLGLDFVSKKINWPRLKKKLPSEDTLRKVRFEFLFDTAKKYKIKKIALAHNQDDQAETVLMRIIRGSGLHGLISIASKRKINSFVIIRPLIETSRKEIIDYLKKIKVKPRIDKSNLNKAFLRNRIRHHILKELAKINPNIKNTLVRFSQQAAVDYDYLFVSSRQFIKIDNGSSVKVSLERFKGLHEALQRMIVRIALEKIAGNLRTFTNKHWEEIQDLTRLRPIGCVVDLTRGIHVKKEKKNIIFYSNKK